MKTRSRGFSMVELLVAMTLALVTVMILMQVMYDYQTRKQTTSGRNEAQINAALGLYQIEREVRMAGAGLMIRTGLLCNVGVNIHYNGVTVSNAGALRPLRIVEGANGAPDALELMRSDSVSGAAPVTVLQAMASPEASLWVDSKGGLTGNELLMVGAGDGSKICTLMQLSQAPQANGSGWNLTHSAGLSPYNPAAAAAVFTTPVRYDVADSVINLGSYGLRRFGVVCSDGGVPTASNRCDLGWFDRLVAGTTPALAQVESVVPQIIDLQAQYGVAPAGSQTVTEWVDASGSPWADPGLEDLKRIKAVRVALVARGNLEPTAVAPASIVLWDAGQSTERRRSLSSDERRYRYQVLSVVIPLINVIWAGV